MHSHIMTVPGGRVPYCSKCGAELSEDARFCPFCGIPVGPPEVAKQEPERRERPKRPISTLAIVLISLIVVAAVVVAVAAALSFLPVRTVGPVTSRVLVPSSTGVDTLDLSLVADVARIRILFEDLSKEWQSPSIVVNASAAGRVGFIGSEDVLNRYMPKSETSVDGSVLTVTVTQDVGWIAWPRVSSLNVTYLVRIDPSLKTSLDVVTTTGGILMDTQAGVILKTLRLEATTGGVEARLDEATVTAEIVSLKTTTGSVKLFWDNVAVVDAVEVNTLTTTGKIEVDVKQDEELLGDIVLDAQAVTGGVRFELEIKGDLGAKIESSVATGGIDVDRRVGFSGTSTNLESNNYPASSNFEVALKTTTGAIDIDAKYIP